MVSLSILSLENDQLEIGSTISLGYKVTHQRHNSTCSSYIVMEDFVSSTSANLMLHRSLKLLFGVGVPGSKASRLFCEPLIII